MSNAIHAHARPIFRATNQPNQNNVIYHQAASPSWATCLLVAGITTCNCGLCHLSEELAKDTYVTVYENKVEYNYPVAAHCCCRYDRHGLIYLDRDIASKAERAGFCTPCCTHNQCFPTCCDACGEGVVLYGATCCSTNQVIVPHESLSCCRLFTVLYGLQNAEELSRAILAQRDVALARAAAPGQVSMK